MQTAEKKIVRSYQDLDVWRRAISLVTEIYRATESFPATERYGLQIQIRQAAVSIPSNIAEGHARRSRKEFLQFISIALGSSAELETQLLIADNLGWIDRAKLDPIRRGILEIGRMLRGLQKSLSSAH